MKNTNESGRSMVEMLGVLAIIGVLSIGGIAGYTLAMNRFRANEVINTASQVAITAMSKDNGMGSDANLADLGGYTALTVPSVKNANNSITSDKNGLVTIEFQDGQKDVADLVASMSGNRVKSNTDKKVELNMQNGVLK